MSKVIKPSDKDLFDSVKKFESSSLETTEARASGSPSVSQNNPGPRGKSARPDPETAENAKKAKQIILDAEKQAARITEQAREKGRAEGLALGREEAKKEADKQLKESSRAVESLISQLKAQEAELMQLLTPRLADLATELARKIIHREIDKDSSLVTSQAEEAVSRILEREKLIIRVNPGDAETMKKHKPALMGMFDGIEKVEVIGDDKVERGGCVVETTLVKVDAQPSSQLEAARKTLLGGTEKT